MVGKVHILYIDSQEEDALSIFKIFDKISSHDFYCDVHHAKSLAQSLQDIEKSAYDLLIVDINLTDSIGLDTLLELQKKNEAIPIILLSTQEDAAIADEAIHLGAQDYLPKKELNPIVLGRLIRFAMERHQLKESLKELSFTDELTGVYNRRGFMTLFEQHLSLTTRTGNGFYLFLIDLDRLKKINDTYGHLMGDRAIIETAKALQHAFRYHDVIARVGGDEFAVLALNSQPNQEHKIKEHIALATQKVNDEERYPFKLSFSLGSTYYGGESKTTIDALMHEADLNLYRAKKESRTKRKISG